MSFEPLLLWVTRSAPHNRRTERRLRAIGHNVIRVPVLEIEPVAQPAPAARPDAILFTSAHGVSHHPFQEEWAPIPVFTVGDRTAETALKAGYRDVRSARGDVTDLQKLVVTSVPRPALIVHFSAEQPAGDLCAYLEMSGYEAVRHVVYRSRAVSDADLGRAIGALPSLDGILVQSPKGARRVAELVAEHRWSGRIFCISQGCAAELHHLPHVQIAVAVRPNEDSLMQLVGLAAGRKPRSAPRRLAAVDGSAPALLTANDNMRWSGATRSPPPDGPDDPPPSAA